MIVRGDEVTLTKAELKDVIIDCSAKCVAKTEINEPIFIVFQGLFTTELMLSINKKIFGDEK